jgi:hypothetical protein
MLEFSLGAAFITAPGNDGNYAKLNVVAVPTLYKISALNRGRVRYFGRIGFDPIQVLPAQIGSYPG